MENQTANEMMEARAIQGLYYNITKKSTNPNQIR